MVSRRRLLGLLPPVLAAPGVIAGNTFQGSRRALVQGHNPHTTAVDRLSPLTVGNGEFAFNADVTGLQSLSAEYAAGTPLCTLSQWGWHSFPNTTKYKPENIEPELVDAYGREVPYLTQSSKPAELMSYLRENPHRLHLGEIGFRLDGRPLRSSDLSKISQTLDLWTGMLESRFEIDGVPVLVWTCCDPKLDLLAVKIRADLLKRNHLTIAFTFPYGSAGTSGADWNAIGRHSTSVFYAGPRHARLMRTLDGDSYMATLTWTGSASLAARSAHFIELRPSGKSSDHLEFTCWFTPKTPGEHSPEFSRVRSNAAHFWQNFWTHGAAVNFSAASENDAREIERRVVLSQYLTAVQCAGSLPPQETGLTCNSWHGKFHLEMHPWHAAHFTLWRRPSMLTRSLAWYSSILPVARKTAAEQGYEGARWPKMVGPYGANSPSDVGSFLIWQQPHPILLAELCRRSSPQTDWLHRLSEIVFASADFMASYCYLEPSRQRYMLGPPVIPAQENHRPEQTCNPTFELQYWSEMLGVAQDWRRWLRLPSNPRWEQVRRNLADLPASDGVYLADEKSTDTFTQKNRDHPSMLAAYGYLSGSAVDAQTMRRTLRKVLDVWDWKSTWGWDYPMLAMTAARLGEPELAVDMLLMDTPKNQWSWAGHTYQRPNLPVYLPSNGGLLLAVAMMAGGWRGAPGRNAPGFPLKWKVQHSGLAPWL